VKRLVHGAWRGAVGAMAMTGMREFARGLGLIDDEPPRALVKRFRSPLRRQVSRENRTTVEAVHWAVGAGGGLAYAVLPDALRRQPWSGPVYGLVVWLSFDALIAPALGVEHARSRPVAQRAVLAVDHILYGLVLTELRARPRDAEVAA
jgi:Family of unknown function (DUF6789)